MSDLALDDEPPALSLPPPTKIGFTAAASLPAALTYNAPNIWAMSYQPEGTAQRDSRRASIGRGAGGAATVWDELKYVRKSGNKAAQAVPAPLYFRQTAAVVHSSPMLSPTSPPPSIKSPGMRPSIRRKTSNSSLHNFALPPSVTSDHSKTSALKPANCGRPGCVGAAAPHRAAASEPVLKTKPGSSTSLHHLGRNDNDLLASPRIRALRNHGEYMHSSSHLGEGEDSSRKPPSDSQHSAFACYLFSHLKETAHPKRVESETVTAAVSPTRGRTASPSTAILDRSLSVDSVMSAPRAPSAVRPTRKMFGGRATPAGQPRLEPLSTLKDEDSTVTIRAVPQKTRAMLTPGHFISATTETPVSSAAFPSSLASTPFSPPTRGRSSNRRPSDAAPADFAELGGADRGRSQARLGNTHRSHSRHREDENVVERGRDSRSRGRHSRAASPVERDSRSRAREDRGRISRAASPAERDSRSRVREDRGRLSRAASPVGRAESRAGSRVRAEGRGRERESFSRGRGEESRGREGMGRRERTVTECTEPDDVEEDEDEDERGRGRGRGADSRSRSTAGRGRGRDLSP